MPDQAWIDHAYPLQQIVVQLQGRLRSTREDIISQLEEVTKRLKQKFNEIGQGYMKRLIRCVLVSVWAASIHTSFAFTVDGVQSQMTQEQLSNLAASRGREIWETLAGVWVVGKRSEYQIDGLFAFCGGGLIAYNRNFDFDADYMTILRSFLEKYGQPRRVEVSQNNIEGANPGIISTTRMIWYSGVDRVILSFNPEGRDGRGQLRYNRSANVGYASKNKCWTEF
jgi:hypothetical protein